MKTLAAGVRIRVRAPRSAVGFQSRLMPALALVLCVCASPSSADEFGFLVGQGHSPEVGNLTGNWLVDYQQNFGRNFAVGVSWVNEGHATNSHRDGAAVQARGRISIIDPRLHLVAGVGPYTYFNTTRAGPSADDEVDHGWGILYSLGATWELGSSWYLQGRLQRIEAHNGHDSNTVLIGAGYRFGPPISGPDSAAPTVAASVPGERNHELGIFAGRVIANTFQSETASAKAIDYRRRVSDTFERTLTLLDENDTGPVRRYGIAGQFWVVRELGSERLTVAGGVGPYLLFKVRGETDSDSKNERLAGLVSLSLAYDVLPSLRARFVFNRVFARHSRDTDVIMLGAAYRY